MGTFHLTAVSLLLSVNRSFCIVIINSSTTRVFHMVTHCRRMHTPQHYCDLKNNVFSSSTENRYLLKNVIVDSVDKALD